MKKWTPQLSAGLDWARLQLSPEEGYLLSRIDGGTSVVELTQLTGLSGERVEQILDGLIAQGAVQPGLASAAPIAPAPAAAAPAPIDFGAPAAVVEPAAALDGSPAGGDADSAELPAEPGADDGSGDLDAADGEHDEQAATLDTDALEPDADLDGMDADVAADAADLDAEAGDRDAALEPDEVEAEEDEAEEAPDDSAEQAAQAERDRNYRKLFETRFHPLPDDQRVQLAGELGGAELLALCFDPEPAVIRALLANGEAGPPHARLIAAHHYNSVGLDAVAGDPRYLRDRQVQRFLLRNTHTSERVLARMLNPKPLLASYQIATSRELSERAKRCAHQALRRRFSLASAEERVALIFKSEGRCLPLLHGTSLDGKTTALLCGHSYTSTLLIQNLLRWSATPPPLLARLFKQPAVQRNPQLRQLVLRHSNCPAQLKREG